MLRIEGNSMNRILPDGRNYLCEGYRIFFQHVAPWMDEMKNKLTMNN